MTNNTTPCSQPRLILIADDLPEVISAWTMELKRRGLRCLAVSSMDDLWIAYELYRDEISGIILDGCIPGHTPNTLPFIRMAREDGFPGYIVAASSSPDYRQQMMQAGCTDQAPKSEAVECLMRLLRFMENLVAQLNRE